MRRFAWVFILAAALLSACGGNSSAANLPTPAADEPAANLPTSAADELATNTSTLPLPTVAPTNAPTAQLILPPTTEPTASGQPDALAQPTAKLDTKAAAQPTTAPRRAPERASAPARIVIDDIKLDYRPVSVGLDKHLRPIVPDHDVAWYNLSSGPGEGDNIVFWGHVLRFTNAPKIPAPFARVKELAPGASVVLYDSAGNQHRYVVKQQIWVKPDEVEYILPRGKEMVTMVSCIGDKVISNGEVIDESHRLITIAEPA
jgi:sortase (surface protein transpeptidase)